MGKGKVAKKAKQVSVVSDSNNSMSLLMPKIPEADLRAALPKVSVVTITYKRGEFVGLMLHNWLNIAYPRDKLEWVIVDDTPDDYPYQLENYIPVDDKYIKYHKVDKHMKIDDKRNYAVGLTSYDYIVHMDDDDYYFPDSILAKIRVMLHYKVKGVISMPFGTYDLTTDKSGVIYSEDSTWDAVPEASLAYKKSYWKDHKFKSNQDDGLCEGAEFITDFRKWANIPFMFNFIGITHGKNVTNKNRTIEETDTVDVDKKDQVGNFADVFPSEVKYILNNIKNIISDDSQ